MAESASLVRLAAVLRIQPLRIIRTCRLPAGRQSMEGRTILAITVALLPINTVPAAEEAPAARVETPEVPSQDWVESDINATFPGP